MSTPLNTLPDDIWRIISDLTEGPTESPNLLSLFQVCKQTNKIIKEQTTREWEKLSTLSSSSASTFPSGDGTFLRKRLVQEINSMPLSNTTGDRITLLALKKWVILHKKIREDFNPNCTLIPFIKNNF